jgi:hypothetical protein
LDREHRSEITDQPLPTAFSSQKASRVLESIGSVCWGTMGPPRRHSLDRSTSMTGVAPPPTQVFTRGRTGSVKTRPQMAQRAAQRRATSMDPSSRSRKTRPRYPSSVSKRSMTSHVSMDNLSYAAASDLSEDHSVHSAPSVPPSPARKNRTADYLPSERREPTSSRASPSIMKPQHHLGKQRDLSPDRSIDVQKQHVRTTRKIVEGRSSSCAGTSGSSGKLHFSVKWSRLILVFFAFQK